MNGIDLTLPQLRQKLHGLAERSHEEGQTADEVVRFLDALEPDRLVRGLGGHGVLARFDGAEPGPRLLLRAELDALPIPEGLSLPYASQNRGTSHKCGHDGHMAMLLGVARGLARQRTRRGSVQLLFQPAEETGEGAAAVLGHPIWEEERPHQALALHNLPGYPLGQVIIRPGVFASASKGMVAALHGRTSHAGEPYHGRSPALALSGLLSGLTAIPAVTTPLHEAALVTVIHAQLGERAFGTTPGEAVIMATLRAHAQETLDHLGEACARLVQQTAAAHELSCDVSWTEVFPSTVNDPEAVEQIEEASTAAGLASSRPPHPFSWSEDFGHFTRAFGGALLGFGSGCEQPPLHHPRYDFPDALLPKGVALWESLIHHLLEWPHVSQ